MKHFSWFSLLWLLPFIGLGLSVLLNNVWLFLLFTVGLLVIGGVAIVRRGDRPERPAWLWVAWCGLAATMIGDYFLVIRHAGLESAEFLGGVAGFGLAHLLWIGFFARNYRINLKVVLALLSSFAAFFWVRMWPVLPSDALRAALIGYMTLSAIDVAFAFGARSKAFAFGLGLLFFSDVMIAGSRVLKIASLQQLVGVTYLAALIGVTLGIVLSARGMESNRRRDTLNYFRRSSVMTLIGGTVTIVCFLLAMYYFPPPGYNPFQRMLSSLGQTKINGVVYPLCSHLFAVGMLIGIGTIAYFAPAFRCFVHGQFRRKVIEWGFALNVGGLLMITLVPENVKMFYHGIGCVMAMTGGGAVLLVISINNRYSRMSRTGRWLWFAWLMSVVAVFQTFLLLFQFRQLPFSPCIPTCQKVLIASFILWLISHAVVLLRDLRAGKRRPPLPPRSLRRAEAEAETEAPAMTGLEEKDLL